MYSNNDSLDIYVGDYIETTKEDNKDISGDKVRWLIADIDNYLHTGYNPELTSHHVTIIPAKPLKSAPMNTSATTTGGYANSEMVKADTSDQTGLGTGTLKDIYDQYIEPDFEEQHIITYSNLLTNQTDDEATNRMGDSNRLGASSNNAWYPRKLDLMSEMNVYGGIVASSSVWDTGIDNRQYAIFRLKPELTNSYDGQRFNVWLKDVASSQWFADVGDFGTSHTFGASNLRGVRPRFLIGYSSI